MHGFMLCSKVTTSFSALEEQHFMKTSRFVWAIAVAAVASMASTERAFAQNPSPQNPSPQYYGYGGQVPTAAPQGGTTCYPTPPPACYPEKYGCCVTVCPCPCQSGGGCIPDIPGIHTPSCTNPCVVINEGPPTTKPVTYDIWRNCYVPFRIDYKPGPSHITPVNINVRWREVHFLCGPDGNPLPPQQASAILKELQAQVAAAADGAQGEAPASPSPAAAAVAPNVNPPAVQPAQAAPAPAQASTPQKQWLWIPNMNMFAYGYINEGGFAVVDEGSYRTSMPTQAAAAPAQATDGLAVAASSTR
jgi:hypothetical protein